MRTMGVKGLTLYHLKSHLQKYRLGKQTCKESAENSKETESLDTGSSSSASKLVLSGVNSKYQVTEALRVQMEVQRRLHEQLEVQRRLQLRIDTQEKYLQAILEKACKALSEEAAGMEAAREELSDLVIKVSSECQGMESGKIPSLFEVAVAMDNGDCSVERCLTSEGMVKKRGRNLYGNGEVTPLEWMMSNIG